MLLWLRRNERPTRRIIINPKQTKEKKKKRERKKKKKTYKNSVNYYVIEREKKCKNKEANDAN